MDSSRLPIVVYLNQKYCFDLLAILEDGLIQLETIRTAQSEGRNNSTQASGEIGIKDVFAFVGVKLGGSRTVAEEADFSHESAAEKVHTPNSLFAKVREYLIEEKLLSELNFDSVATGNFVEFRGAFQRNPLIVNLETFVAMMNLASLFDNKSTEASDQSRNQPSRQSGRRQQGQTRNTNGSPEVISQIKALIEQLNANSNLDLIGRICDKIGTAILTVDRSFLAAQSLAELVDGEYTVLGKVTRILRTNTVSEDSLGTNATANLDNTGRQSTETIELLRNTSLAPLSDEILQQLLTVFDSLQSSGMKIPTIKMEDLRIGSPAIQVVPIAIFA